MECYQIENKLIDFIDKSLEKKDTEQVSDHLNKCDSCRNELEKIVKHEDVS